MGLSISGSISSSVGRSNLELLLALVLVAAGALCGCSNVEPDVKKNIINGMQKI